MLSCSLNSVIPSATGHFNKISFIFYHHDVSAASTEVWGEGQTTSCNQTAWMMQWTKIGIWTSRVSQSELPEWPVKSAAQSSESLWFQIDNLQLQEQYLKPDYKIYSNVLCHFLPLKREKKATKQFASFPWSFSVRSSSKTHACTDREQQNSLWKSSRPTALICYGSNKPAIKRNSNPCSAVLQSLLYKGGRDRKAILHPSL